MKGTTKGCNLDDLSTLRSQLRSLAAARLVLRPGDRAAFDAAASNGRFDRELQLIWLRGSRYRTALERMQGDGPVDVDFIDIIDRWAALRKPVMALPAVAATLPPAPTTLVPQAEPTAAEPVQPTGRTMATGELADAFDGIMDVTSQQWRKRLGDLSNHPWLKPARATQTAAPHPATWWPLKFAELLLERNASLESLNRAFLAPQLKPWLTDWQEAKRERNAFGQ